MPRPIRIVCTAIAYFVFGVGGLLGAYVLLPLLSRREPDPVRRALRAKAFLQGGASWFVDLMRGLGLLRFNSAQLPELLRDGKPAVVIANHPSLIDVLFLLAAIPRLTIIAKRSWYEGPLVGRYLKACGHVCAPDGSSQADGAIALRLMIEALESGSTVLIFPEGTRSPRKGLGPYKRGAFEAALRARVPVVPMVIENDPPMLRKDQPWYEVPERAVEYRLWSLPVIHPDTFPATSKKFCQEVRRRYLSVLELDAADGSPAPVPLRLTTEPAVDVSHPVFAAATSTTRGTRPAAASYLVDRV